MLRTLVIGLLIALSSTALAQEAARTVFVIHCGELLDLPGEPARGQSTIIVRDGRIDDVLDGYLLDILTRTDETVEFVDLTDEFVLPGLIDCHTHVTGELKPMGERLKKTLTEQPTHSAIDGVVYAERTLMAGFTTVRNVGSMGADIYALRNRINQGVIPGPRILAAGRSIAVTGGHADRTNGISPILRPEMTPMEGIADGPYEMRKAVRERIKRGSDLIKITATGGVLSNTAAGVDQQMFEDEIRAVVETARMMGRRVAAHAHGTDGIKAAIRGGVDSIEHGTYLDDEAIELFKEHDCYLVPTIHAGKFVAQKAGEPGYFNPAIREKAERVGPQIQASVAKAYKAGVKIAFGTDVGVGEHGTNALEFVYMREAGVSPSDCIVSATINAADLCGLAGEVGAIQKGMAADIIAVESNPLNDVAALQDIRFVMARGQIYRDKDD